MANVGTEVRRGLRCRGTALEGSGCGDSLAGGRVIAGERAPDRGGGAGGSWRLDERVAAHGNGGWMGGWSGSELKGDAVEGEREQRTASGTGAEGAGRRGAGGLLFACAARRICRLQANDGSVAGFLERLGRAPRHRLAAASRFARAPRPLAGWLAGARAATKL